MTTNLAVADPERGEGTICLAFTPSMKALGIKNRCRVYQIPKTVKYIKAPPRMKRYIEYSADIYAVYLKYIAKEDIHVYSIDEAFLDVTHYLSLYRLNVRELTLRIMKDIKETTGITAATGIGTNLYLAKVALDIMAKHAKDNIGYLDEKQYQKILWDHRPITDFWRVGAGTAKRLAGIGIVTMRDVAHTDEEMLYRLFGVDAELLVDHAWGRESTTMQDIKTYQPKNHSFARSQVLLRDYTYEDCKLLVKEMVDDLCLEMAEQGMEAKSVSMTVGYSYKTEAEPATGTVSMPDATKSYRVIAEQILCLYERIVLRDKPIRKLSMTCNGMEKETYEQYDLFTDYHILEKEQKMQRAVLEIKKKYGKNAVIRGMNLQEAGTAIERNRQIGGHKSGE